ncbi:hypothetical protein AAZX31_03G076600 [Glycine max]
MATSSFSSVPCSSSSASSLVAISSSLSKTLSFTSLKGSKRPKSRPLAKNPTCLMAFLLPFSSYSTTFFLKISSPSSSSLLASLSLATRSSNSFSIDFDSFSRASRSATFMASSSLFATTSSTLPAKFFLSSCKTLQCLNNSSLSNLESSNLANTLPTLEDNWWFELIASTREMVALATLGHSALQIVRAATPYLVALASKDTILFSASWCHCPFSSRIARLC